MLLEFFALFARLRPGLLARIETVERLLESDRSAVVEVWAADGVRPQQRAKDRSDVVIINRVLPATTIEIETRPNQRRQLDLQSSVGAADLHHIDSEEMRKAVGSLLVGSGAISLSIPEDAAVALVARTAGGVNDLDDLQTMIDEAIALGPIIDQV